MKREGPEGETVSERITYSANEVHRMKERLNLISSALPSVIYNAVLTHKAIGFARTIQDVVEELTYLYSSDPDRVKLLQYLEIMDGIAKELMASIVSNRFQRIHQSTARICLYDLTQQFFLNEFAMAGKKKIDIKPMNEKQGPLYVDCDPWALKQVLQILAENAVQAMAQTSIKELTANVQASNTGSVILRLLDTGAGIPANLKEKIFKTALADESINGRGLGTALAAILIGHYDGEICVENTSGAGTCIKIELPLSPME